MTVKESMGYRLLLIFMYAVVVIFALACLIPFVTVISSSLSTEGYYEIWLLHISERVFVRSLPAFVQRQHDL